MKLFNKHKLKVLIQIKQKQNKEFNQEKKKKPYLPLIIIFVLSTAKTNIVVKT